MHYPKRHFDLSSMIQDEVNCYWIKNFRMRKDCWIDLKILILCRPCSWILGEFCQLVFTFRGYLLTHPVSDYRCCFYSFYALSVASTKYSNYQDTLLDLILMLWEPTLDLITDFMQESRKIDPIPSALKNIL